MKILYIITQGHGGGAQKYTLALARHFGGAVAAGTEAEELFTDAKRAGIACLELNHLKRNINPWHDFLATAEIRRLIKSYKPDIVHLNSSKAGILGSFAAIGLKTKVVFTAHGFVFNEPLPFWLKSLYLALEKIASGYRDFIITVSDADKQSALDNNIIAADKTQTIHNGIGPINFLSQSQARAALGLADDKFIIGCVAGFYKTKGLDVLVGAIAMLADDIKAKIVCAIIGDGPEKADLKLKIENLRLSNTIKTLGQINDAASCLKAFDLFVLPSRKEGFPFTLLEALQAELPIIATNVGGNAEALGHAGVLVNPNNAKALAQAIASMVTDEGKRKDLSQKALERSKLFTEQKMLEETEKVYKQLLSA